MKPPNIELDTAGTPVHFLHANGYPPECYKPFLELLQTQYHVFAMLLRPLWLNSDPNEIKDWHPFSDDLLRFLREHSDGPVIGVGHSIGAIVTLRAAIREPEKFRALILIDPVLFVPSFMLRWHMVRVLGLADRLHPLIPGAKKRRRSFDSLGAVYRGYRNRQVFRYMSDENLQIYIEGITRKDADGSYSLVYSPAWEAHIYRTGMHDFDLWRGLPGLAVPMLFIRGAETDTFLESAANFVKRRQPAARVETLPESTHLLPLERPQEVFDIMQSFLEETRKVSVNHSTLNGKDKDL
ncbi:MAG TPA: alpha/beta hydrolase [Anaerolineales bacterium]|nr:alpha/beta hydrolase [Anaerolineales bacterium]